MNMYKMILPLMLLIAGCIEFSSQTNSIRITKSHAYVPLNLKYNFFIDKDNLKCDNQIIINLNVENIGKKPYTIIYEYEWGSTYRWPIVDFTIYENEGVINLKKDPEGRPPSSLVITRIHWLKLDPQKTIQFKFYLSRYYQIIKPGEYNIACTYHPQIQTNCITDERLYSFPYKQTIKINVNP